MEAIRTNAFGAVLMIDSAGGTSRQSGVPHGIRQNSPSKNGVRTLVVVLLSLPMISVIIGAFGERWFFPRLLPEVLSLRAWDVLTEPTSGIVGSLITGTLIAIFVSATATLIAAPAGYALARMAGQARAPLLGLIVAPATAPGFALAMGLHLAWIYIGIDRSIIGVAMAQLVPATPYAVLIMASAFTRVNPMWEHQARSLGASTALLSIHVLLPLVRPSLAVAAGVAFIVAWGEYTIVLLLGGGGVITLPLHVVTMALGGDRASASALTIVYLLPPLIALALLNVFGVRRS